MDFNAGDRVTVKTGELVVGGAKFVNCKFANVEVLRKNPDGSYGVRLNDIVKMPGMEDVDVPAEWLQPRSGA